MNTAAEVRSLIAPISGGGILLPGSMIAEVVNYSEPEAFATGPEWLLGELRWNGWQIPIVNFALLAGLTADDAVPDRARVLVVKNKLGPAGKQASINVVFDDDIDGDTLL